jgi:drug/metabolite transporter (DMT)-like permease
MRTFLLTALALIAFAGNSLLCRLALKQTAIDPATFSTVRIIAGALALWLLLHLRPGASRVSGTWTAAAALATYVLAFSFAYVSLTAGTGALVLFGSVQATMIGYGIWKGERLRGRTLAGLVLALGGLLGLVLPGLSAPPLLGCTLMLAAGVAWGVYSLRGRGTADPLGATTGNFMRGVVPVVLVSLLTLSSAKPDLHGMLYAVLSGAITSGIGYAIWYMALRHLSVTSAGTAQLMVPVIAALGGVVLLGEPLTLRLVMAGTAILGGVALVVIRPTARSA